MMNIHITTTINLIMSVLSPTVMKKDSANQGNPEEIIKIDSKEGEIPKDPTKEEIKVIPN